MNPQKQQHNQKKGIQSHIVYKVVRYSLKGNVFGPPPRGSKTAVRIFRIGCTTGLTSPRKPKESSTTPKSMSCHLFHVMHWLQSLEYRRKKVVDAASGYAGIRNKMIAERERECFGSCGEIITSATVGERERVQRLLWKKQHQRHRRRQSEREREREKHRPD